MTDTALPPLSYQQEQYVLYRVRGLSPEAAAYHAKLPSDAASLYAMHEANPAIDMQLLRMRDEVRRHSIRAGVKVQFSKDDAALMYLEAHSKAKDATEEIKAVDSLVRLFGLAEPEKREVAVTRKSQLKELDDVALMQMVGTEILLDPADYVRNEED